MKEEIITAEGFTINQQWLNLIQYVQTIMPEGELKIQFAAGSPLQLTEQPRPKIRFDKGALPKATNF